jgi:SAM-dependent methyltransferase
MHNKLNTIKGQIEHWKEYIKNFSEVRYKRSEDESWRTTGLGQAPDVEGLVEKAIIREDSYHPYKESEGNIEKLLQECELGTGLTIIDLGCLTGKWIGHLIPYAEEIICVDLIDDGFWYIKNRYQNQECKFKFYITKGNELEGTDTDSVDLIFSIDSLMRTPIASIDEYFVEFSRVMKKGSTLCLHLAAENSGIPETKNMPILSEEHIKGLCDSNNLEFVKLDSSVLNLGSVLVATRK